GRVARRRRGDIVLSTKLGYGVPGVPDWTGPCITRGIEQARARLGVDALDVAHLHSCPLAVLTGGEVVEALLAAVSAGQVRAAAYSGEGEALDHAVACGAFAVVQASCSLVDPAGAGLRRARTAGLGTIAKRPLGNGAWQQATRPDAPDRGTYFDRWQALALPELGLPADEVWLRWVAWHPAVDAAIAGTTSAARLRHNAAIVARGPLPADVLAAIDAAQQAAGAAAWPGVV
ncbi:MAG: aldo/keto reductase, partial [Myxococcota bacterium]